MDTQETLRAAPGRGVGTAFTLVLLALIGMGIVYDGALALGLTEVGPLPGDMPSGESLVLVSFAALVLGGLLLLLASCTRWTAEALATPLLPLLGLAAVAFAVAHYYSFDAYFAPDLNRRVASVMGISGWWMVVLALGAVWAGFVAWRVPRLGTLVQGLFLWVTAFALFAIGPWH